MKDNEIIKALECCSMETECRRCPLYKLHSARCVNIACENALDIITRLKDKEREYRAKVQSQRYEINCNQKNIERYKGVIKILEKDVATAKSEAVKEFAERLKKPISKCRLTAITEKETCSPGSELWEFWNAQEVEAELMLKSIDRVEKELTEVAR